LTKEETEKWPYNLIEELRGILKGKEKRAIDLRERQGSGIVKLFWRACVDGESKGQKQVVGGGRLGRNERILKVGFDR